MILLKVVRRQRREGLLLGTIFACYCLHQTLFGAVRTDNISTQVELSGSMESAHNVNFVYTPEMNLSQYMSFLRNSRIISDDKAEDGNSHSTPSFHIRPTESRWDGQRKHKIFDRVFIGPSFQEASEAYPICLATQSSVDRLFWLADATKYWFGTVSVAVYTPGIEFGIAQVFFRYLVSCYPTTGGRMSVHFVYPEDIPPELLHGNFNEFISMCDQPKEVLTRLLSMRSAEVMKWRDELLFPQNLVRNVARKNCQSDWVFLLDVDIIIPPGFSERLQLFLQSRAALYCQKCAFVIPTFEVDEKAKLPHSAAELHNLLNAKKAQPFHWNVFKPNQAASKIPKWIECSKETPEVHICVEVVYSKNYEPFYVSSDTTPQHDERFVGFGYTRNTQTYEMWKAGWEFKVISPLFTVHWGFQTTSMRSSSRIKQIYDNMSYYEKFKKELDIRYETTPKPQPKISNNRKVQRSHRK